jgi:hypothetical protein
VETGHPRIHRFDEPDFGGRQSVEGLGFTRSVNRAVRVLSVLLNHFVRSRQHIGWDRKADLLGGF